MIVFVHSDDVFNYFENIVCPSEGKQFTSVFHCSCFMLYSSFFEEHSRNYKCFCFKCRIHKLLIETLISKGYRNIIYISGNYNVIILVKCSD